MCFFNYEKVTVKTEQVTTTKNIRQRFRGKMVQVHLNHFTTHFISEYFDMFLKTIRDGARGSKMHLNHFTSKLVYPLGVIFCT